EEYPEGCLEAMKEQFRTIAVDAEGIAEELGNAKCMNVVLFGALADSLGMDDIDWEAVVAETVPQKARDLNLEAFRRGREAAVNAKA
ncbi:MAG: 2-oxoacid:acceptor oxidoreductase family protein, partial [Anaerovoracaceae bacterium]|nr:2-oxoacid:acceptor oxidoreductase family protein [Anaerovoracaceae bacterium]